MTNILSQHPIILLFLVAAMGYMLGNIKIKGGSLGVAAVLFTGLVVGSLNRNFVIPDIIFLLGLSMYVYSIGIRSGPSFFDSYKQNGIRDFTFIMSMLFMTGLIAVAVFLILDFSAATVVGIYTGSTTNTAAMAGIIELISSNPSDPNIHNYMDDVAVGYAYSYPMGAMGGIIAIVILEKLFVIDYKAEEESIRSQFPIGDNLTSATLEILNPDVTGVELREIMKNRKWQVNFGRIKSEGKVSLMSWERNLKIGDQLLVIGNLEDIKKVEALFGKMVESPLSYDRSKFDVRRIFVSNARIAGNTIASLNLHERFNATITRIRRGDIDMLARMDTVLELGDRIRFIAERKDLKDLATYFGDSYKRSSKVNIFSFGLGIALGLILGSMEFSFGESFSIKLGYAGGPLIVGLILGTIRKTGPVVWTLPYGANVTLEQIGLIFLLSAIGVKSGNAFVESLNAQGLSIFLTASFVSVCTAFFTLFVGYKLLKMPFVFLLGMVSNHPGILEFARARSGSKVVDYGFTMAFPIALIMKVVIAQLLYIFLSGLG